MTIEQFRKHLFTHIWNFYIAMKTFDVDYGMSLEQGAHFPWEYDEYLPTRIEKLFNDLQVGVSFSENYQQIVHLLNNDERDVIMRFMAWFYHCRELTSMDMYMEESYYSGLNISALDDLVNYVEKIGPFETEVQKDELSDGFHLIMNVLKKFKTASTSLTQPRRKGKETLQLLDEHDVQDFLLMLLKPHFSITAENVVETNIDRQFLKIDFLIAKEKIAIECKFNRDRDFRQFRKEIADDLLTYSKHQDCNTIIFFVFDGELKLSNPLAIEKEFTQKHTIAGKEIAVFLVFNPTGER